MISITNRRNYTYSSNLTPAKSAGKSTTFILACWKNATNNLRVETLDNKNSRKKKSPHKKNFECRYDQNCSTLAINAFKIINFYLKKKCQKLSENTIFCGRLFLTFDKSDTWKIATFLLHIYFENASSFGYFKSYPLFLFQLKRF